MADPVATERRPARERPLYETDYCAWIQEQVALLRAGRLDEVDAARLAEELDDVGKSEHAKLESALRVLVMHMLKWDQQPEHRTPSWVFSIREQRRRYRRLVEQSPSLAAKRDLLLGHAYPTARDWAANETSLPVDEFPDACPYSWDDLLERPFEVDRMPPR
jgi:hypothetical protein